MWFFAHTKSKFKGQLGCMAEWKGVLLPGGRLELMVKPRGATPTTLVSLLIDHIVAKASSTIFPYCMPIRFSEAIHSTISMENRSSIFLSHLITFISKQGMILYIIQFSFRWVEYWENHSCTSEVGYFLWGTTTSSQECFFLAFSWADSNSCEVAQHWLRVEKWNS